MLKFEDLSPENKEVLQLRSACPYNKLIYSAYEAI
jgi:hypothetical protein